MSSPKGATPKRAHVLAAMRRIPSEREFRATPFLPVGMGSDNKTYFCKILGKRLIFLLTSNLGSELV